MPKSSINIQPVKANSEAHNLRKTSLDYVHQEETHKNKSVVLEKIHPTRSRLERLVKKKTGRAMQKKATPIREGVVILGPKNTMEDLVEMCGTIEEKLKVKTMQIHIHEDEGHTDKETGKWKQNRHAHIVFNWINEETGRSHKLLKQDMATMQTIVAESLGLERGQSSDKKHLNSMEFKAQKKAEEAEKMEGKVKEAEKELQVIKTKHKAENLSHGLKKGITSTFKRLGGVNQIEKLEEQLEGRIIRFEKLRKENQELEEKLKNSVPRQAYDTARENNRALLARFDSMKAKLQGDLEEKNKQMKTLNHVLREITVNGNKEVFENARSSIIQFDQKQQEKEERQERIRNSQSKGPGISM